MPKYNIFIVDDHRLFREGLKLILSSSELIGTIKIAENGLQLLENIDSSTDIVLIDIEMPGMNGIDTTKELVSKIPTIKVIALTMFSNENYAGSMINAGAKGFMLKNSDIHEVEQAIRIVGEGKNYFTPEVLDRLISSFNRKSDVPISSILTERETEVLFNICKGFSNQEIADLLFISKRTVDKHRENLLLKTSSKNTAGLVIFAIKNSIIEI